MNHGVDMNWLNALMDDATRLALSHFGNTRGTLKADASWVTEADLAVEKLLREEISKARPNDAIVGEEGDKTADPAASFVWALDPIDGTRVFNHGLPVWGVSVGLLVEGRPTVGAFSLPALGDLYLTDGTTAYLNGRTLSPPEPRIEANALFLVSEGAYKGRRVDYPGKVISLGSAAANLCYVARGSAVGAMDEAGVWDYAAGAAILAALGITLRLVSGRPVDYPSLYDGRTVPEPTLAAPDALFEALQRSVHAT